MANAPLESGARGPPRLLDALLPVVVLILLLALTIVLFGVSATDGPLQVALLLSAAFASLVAFKNGYTVASVAEATVGGVATALGAVFILLAVGALIGTWNMAGTIPTVVDYGLRIVSPTWFYFTAAAVCALVGMVTGSSWTTAGTLGVAFVGMSNVLGLDEAIAAGAVICGAYFGDKMTPLSETTILVPQPRGRRPHGRAARAEHALDGGTRPGDQPRGVPAARPGGGPGRRRQHGCGPRRPGRGVRHLGPQPAASGPAGGPGDPADAAVPLDPRLGRVRGRAGPLPAVGRGGGLRRRPEPRARWRPRSRRGTPPWPPGS